MVDICKSGGAKGADTAWGGFALAAGHSLVHYAFSGMGMIVENRPHRKIMHHLDLAKSVPLLKEAGEWLQRGDVMSYPPYTLGLLQRNYFQIAEDIDYGPTERIYAISYITDPHGLVGGGTGWAVTMGVLYGIKEIYVFDQAHDKWFKFQRAIKEPVKKMEWEEMKRLPPAPHGIYAGIGSVEIKPNGLDAIAKIHQ